MNRVFPWLQPVVGCARSRALSSAGFAPRARAGSRASVPSAPDRAQRPRAASVNVGKHVYCTFLLLRNVI